MVDQVSPSPIEDNFRDILAACGVNPPPIRGTDRCRRVLFSLARDDDLPEARRELGIEDWDRFGQMPEGAQSRILKRCKELALGVPRLRTLPPMAAVIPDASGEHVPGLSDDIEVVLAVLSRCSRSVYVRRKPPIMVPHNLARSLTLALPMSWEGYP